MDTAIDISTLVLAFLNGVLVLLTTWSVRVASHALDENKRVNQQSREAFDQQLRITTFPQLFSGVHIDSEKTIFTLYNSGTLPGYDVDILALGVYDNDDHNFLNFIVEYVQEDHAAQARNITLEGSYYAVYEHLFYEVVPQHRRIDVPLGFPPGIDMVYALIQFRDILGHNYYQLFYFFTLSKSPEGRLRLGSMDSSGTIPQPRIDYGFSKNSGYMVLTGSTDVLPEMIEQDFRPMFSASIPAGHLRGPYEGPEDRGEWHDIS